MLKVTVAGCGLIAAKKHIPSLLKLKKKAKIVAVCDLHEDAAKKIAHMFNIKKTYSDFSEMLSQEKPDIVDICTPPQTHSELTIRAVKEGSHVLLEKPMALDISDCDAMIEAATMNQKKIGVIHNQIFNPAFIKAKGLISKGEIGDFLGVHILLSTPTDYMTSEKEHWAHRLPGGVLGETGPHGVYLALAFLKSVYDVDIYAKKLLAEYPWSNFEDYRIALIAENGLGTINLIFGSNQWAANIDIIGTSGMLKIDLETQTIIKYRRSKLAATSLGLSLLDIASQALRTAALNSLRYFFAKGNDAHTIGIHKFVDSILDGMSPPVTAEDGKETVRVMQMIVERLNIIRDLTIIKD